MIAGNPPRKFEYVLTQEEYDYLKDIERLVVTDGKPGALLEALEETCEQLHPDRKRTEGYERVLKVIADVREKAGLK